MKIYAGFAALLTSFILSLPAFAEPRLGEAVPLFTTQASFAGKALEYSLKDALRKGPVVVYFYPTAFGGGCSIQARAFAQSYDQFVAAGATIVGVSLDDIGRLNKFSADPEFCASRFPVASDPEGKIVTAYGLKINESTRGRKDIRGETVDHGSIDRSTFIIDSDGKLIATLDGLKPADNVAKSLEAIQHLKAHKG